MMRLNLPASLLTDFKDSIGPCINSITPGDMYSERPFWAIRYLTWYSMKRLNPKPLELRLPDNILAKQLDPGWWTGFWRNSAKATFQTKSNGLSSPWSTSMGSNWATTGQECWDTTLTEIGTSNKDQRRKKCFPKSLQYWTNWGNWRKSIQRKLKCFWTCMDIHHSKTCLLTDPSTLKRLTIFTSVAFSHSLLQAETKTSSFASRLTRSTTTRKMLQDQSS